MHELGIMTGVMDAVNRSAEQAGALKVLKVTLSIGEMTEAIEDSLRFAFEVLTEGTNSEGAELVINMVKPKSRCLDCGSVYEHDRFHMACDACGSFATELIAGRELQIDSIEVDLPDADDGAGDPGGSGEPDQPGQPDEPGKPGDPNQPGDPGNPTATGDSETPGASADSAE